MPAVSGSENAGERIHLDAVGLINSVVGTTAESATVGAAGEGQVATGTAETAASADASPISATIKAGISTWPAESAAVVAGAAKAGIHLGSAASAVTAELTRTDDESAGRIGAGGGTGGPAANTV